MLRTDSLASCVCHDLQPGALWQHLSADRRAVWAAHCAGLCQVQPAPTPFEPGAEALIDLAALAARVADLDLAELATVTPGAVRARQLAQFAGRLCAEAALQAQGHALAAPIGRLPDGAPAWPDGWSGAITHASGVAMAVVQRRQGDIDIGLDTEGLITGASTLSAVQAQCLLADELAGVDPALRAAALTLVFSAKEAYYKAARPRVGRMIDFKEMRLAGLNPTGGGFDLLPVAGPLAGLPAAHGQATWVGQRVVTRVVTRVAQHLPARGA